MKRKAILLSLFFCLGLMPVITSCGDDEIEGPTPPSAPGAEPNLDNFSEEKLPTGYLTTFVFPQPHGYKMFTFKEDKTYDYEQNEESGQKKTRSGTYTYSSSTQRIDIVFSNGETNSITISTSYDRVLYYDGLEGHYVWSPTDDELKGTGTTQGHEYIDLGLPSGTLWATCNVGASKPEEYGNYYAWGETQSKSKYNWDTYMYCNGTENTMTKYCTNSNYGSVDNITELEAMDDAATVNWGSRWQTPSSAQWNELFSECRNRNWELRNGIWGMTFTSNHNWKTIFLPASGTMGYAGWWDEYSCLDDEGWGGRYQSRSLFYDSNYPSSCDQCCEDLRFCYSYRSDHITNCYYEDTDVSNRFLGLSVRPVVKK